MDRSLIEAHMALAKKHVAQGERQVARQRARVGRLAKRGYDTAAAEALLRSFEQIQAAYIEDLDRIAKALDLSGG